MSSDPAAAEAPQKDSLVTQFKSLSGVFWISGWMEIIERFSYYGARVVLTVFMVLAIGEGGPELTQIQKGQIFGIWAVVQSFVPIVSGGFADRYGYKFTIALSSLCKLLGYLVMAYCIPLTELIAGMPMDEARAAGNDHAYAILFIGAILVAFGTAVFKPGIGGLISSQLTPRNSALGWSVFYQLVNVGGFVGPLVAAYLRLIEWHYAFVACAAAIALNFIPLFFFKEPARSNDGEEPLAPLKMFYQSICGLLEPRMFFYTLSFAGFWLMTFQIFDILPNFITDWVDSRQLASALKSIFGGVVAIEENGNLTQEWMLNFNPLLIATATFLMGYCVRKVPPLVTILLGIVVAIFATYGLGMSMNGWWILGCILLFSLGEMMSGPANSFYVVSIAPKGGAGRYIGYSGFTVGIGWSIGSLIAAHLYQAGGDKVVLAKRYMEQELGVSPEVLADLPKEKVLPHLQQLAGVDGFGARDLLWEHYAPYSMWTVFALIGVGSLLILSVYNKVMKAAQSDPNHVFNRKGDLWVKMLLVPMTVGAIYATYQWFSLTVLLITIFFGVMLVISWLPNHMRIREEPLAK